MLTGRISWLLFGLLVAGPVLAEYQPDYAAVVKDLQMVNRSADRLTVVVWLPAEFWRLALESGGRVTPKEIDRLLQTIDSYVLVSVVDGR